MDIALPADTGDDSLVNVRRLRAQLDAMKARALTLDAELTEAAKDIASLTKQLAAAKAVLEDCRPLVKGRLLDLDGQHGDQDILGRIAAVLEDKP